MYVEVTQTLAKTPLVTRGDQVPDQDLETPLIVAAGMVVVAGGLIWWILRRRKRRRLELWQRRASQNLAEDTVLSGVSAESARSTSDD